MNQVPPSRIIHFTGKVILLRRAIPESPAWLKQLTLLVWHQKRNVSVMRLDPVITRRFAELSTKGEAVLTAKSVEFYAADTHKPHCSVPSGPYREWLTNALNLLHRTFGESSVHYKHLADRYAKFDKWESHFQDSFYIFKAAKEDYEGGYLFKVRSLAKAEVLSDALGQAKELLQHGYKDPACVLARVALESTLKDLCDQNNIPHGKLDKMNADLCKANVFNLAKQKQITAWAEIGNKAAHGMWSEYTEHDAGAMVFGVEALVADLL